MYQQALKLVPFNIQNIAPFRENLTMDNEKWNYGSNYLRYSTDSCDIYVHSMLFNIISLMDLCQKYKTKAETV